MKPGVNSVGSRILDALTLGRRHKTGQTPEAPVSDEASGAKTSTPPWDDSQQRAVLLGRDAATGKVTLGNIRWGYVEGAPGERWKPIFQDTTFDPSKVKNVYVFRRRLEGLGAWHVSVAFEFEPDAPVVAGNGRTSKGLVYSMHAHVRQGDKWSMKTESPKLYQLTTWEDTMQMGSRLKNMVTKRNQLDGSRELQQERLEACVADALLPHEGEIYTAVKENCVGAAVHVLNSVDSQKMLEWLVPGKVRNPLTSIPPFLTSALDMAHLLKPGVPEVETNAARSPQRAAPPWQKTMERYLAATCDFTSGVASALVPNCLRKGVFDTTFQLLSGQAIANALHRHLDRVFESPDVYPLPPQTAAELATNVLHGTPDAGGYMIV